MIDNLPLQNILETCTDYSTVCEIYSADAVPTVDGFDPVDAIDCFAAVEGITFRTRTYKRLIESFGKITKTITNEINNASVTFSNVSREISTFEFTNGFEGLIMVIRGLSRSQSTTLATSKIEFAGRCEKPNSGDKESLTVTAKFILGSLDINVPRRKFAKDDAEGRVATDVEFEGFLFVPQYGTTTYVRRERRGWLGSLLWFFRRTVHVTAPWSSYSDVDASKPVPEVFGRTQVMGVLVGAADVGSYIQILVAFCEGEIEDIINARSTDQQLPLHPSNYIEHLGLVGVLNGPPDYGWVAPGYYSRTAHIRGQALNSLVDVNDPAPDIVAVIAGRKMMTPNPSTGVWDTFAWSDNPAAQARFLLTSPDYYKLDTNWIDDDYALTCFNFNAEQIFDTSISDFLFVEAG